MDLGKDDTTLETLQGYETENLGSIIKWEGSRKSSLKRDKGELLSMHMA